MNFKTSETYKNLLAARDGELKASTRYAISSSIAREDGYEQIADIFEETSGNEKEHAEIWIKLLNEDMLPDTMENLMAAAEGEQYEWTTMYKNFAKTAHAEGFHDIAELFEGVARIENHHDYRFRKLMENMKTDQVFCKSAGNIWLCLNCGNLYYGKCAPAKCPVCGYPQGYYELNCDNY